MSRWIAALLAGLSTLAILLFAFLGWRHVNYPVELDYIEGVMMDHIARAAQGQPLYVAPSLDFVTLAYMPLYTVVSGLLSRVVGLDFWVPRLLSFLSALGIAAMAAWIVRRETRDALLGLAAAGVYLMGYGTAGGGHYDIIRPDSMMLLLSLVGLSLLRYTTGRTGAIAAAVVLTLAFFTKQHAMWFVLAGLVHLAVNDRRRLLPYGVVAVLGCAGGYLVLSAWLGPWFSFTTWDMPAHWSHPDPIRIQRYLGGGLLGLLGGLTVPALLTLGLRPEPWRGREGIWVWMGLGGMGTGLLATLDPSAWRHVFLPSMMTLAVLGPLSCHRLREAWSRGDAGAARRFTVVLHVLLCWQFIPLYYSFKTEMGNRGARQARAAFEAELRALPGPVIVVEHGFYARSAGKAGALQVIALGDIERAPGNRLVRRDPQALERVVAPLRSGPGRPTLIVDSTIEDLGPLWKEIAPGYRLARDLGELTAPLTPISGHRLPPRYVFVPVGSGAADSTAAAR